MIGKPEKEGQEYDEQWQGLWGKIKGYTESNDETE